MKLGVPSDTKDSADVAMQLLDVSEDAVGGLDCFLLNVVYSMYIN